MAFPTNPTNGQLANVNGITYTYSTTTAAWQVTSSFPQSSNTTVASLVATGNVTATYLCGNGSQLSGISRSGSGNVLVLTRSSTITIPVVSSILTVLARSGNISIPVS